MTLLYPDPEHPYYIVTPPYEITSAGIRCLHLLCHCLNRRGQVAYIVQDPLSASKRLPLLSGPNFDTPSLTRHAARYNSRRSKVPVLVYPETVIGNPYQASCVVRYVLNFPGVLGGASAFGAQELIYGFTRALAASCGVADKTLYIPWIDTRTFKLPGAGATRRGTCFYASKYRNVHNGVPFAITNDSIEITRGERTSQSTEEVAALLQSSELFYTYENTALAVEAVLCGCPVVYLPNPHLDKLILAHELGLDGVAWGPEPQEVARAKATVAEAGAAYFRSIEDFWKQLDDFIVATQDHARRSRPDAQLEMRLIEEKVYRSLTEAIIVEGTRRLPRRVEREAGKLLSTLGCKTIGAALWDSSLERDGRFDGPRRGPDLRLQAEMAVRRTPREP